MERAFAPKKRWQAKNLKRQWWLDSWHCARTILSDKPYRLGFVDLVTGREYMDIGLAAKVLLDRGYIEQ